MKSSKQHSLIIVTPVFEDIEASSLLFKEISTQFGHEVFVIAVDDGSLEQPLKISSLENAGLDGVILKLKRNLGHQRAIAIGLSYVSENIKPEQSLIIMDSDGEDLPSTIPYLLSELKSPDLDVVVSRRKSRVETIRFKFFYALYKLFFTIMTGRMIEFGNFMALKASAVKRLVIMQELSIHLAGAVLASKLRIKICPLHRGPRYAGQSKMNFVGLVLHGFKGLMVFAEDVLVRVGIACAFIGIISVLCTFAVFALKLFGISTPGWFSVALGLLFLIFLQMIVLAIMTLMMLMLAGIIRGGVVTKIMPYTDFIEEIIKTKNISIKS